MHKNEYLKLIDAYVNEHGLCGLKIPEHVRKKVGFGNIKNWTQSDWDDIEDDPWNWYAYVDVTPTEYVVYIFKREDGKHTYHPKYDKMTTQGGHHLTMNHILSCRQFLFLE